MKNTIIINNENYEVNVIKESDEIYSVEFAGNEYKVNSKLLTPDNRSLIIDSKSYDVNQFKKDDGYQFVIGRETFDVQVFNDRDRKKLKIGALANADGKEVINSPMPGKVIKVLVSEGDTVTPGQGVIVVEAMKMENELKCSTGGTVEKIFVKEEDTVDGSTKLLEIQAPIN